MRTVEHIEKEIIERTKEIEALEAQVIALQKEVAELKYSEKYPIGSYLLYNGRKLVVTGYVSSGWGVLYACRIKKDGTPEARQRSLCNFELENIEKMEGDNANTRY